MIKINLDKQLLLSLPILSGAMWGFGGVFIRTLHNIGLNSVSIFSTRVIGASIILFILLLLFNRDALKINLKDLWLFIGSGVLGALLLNLSYNEAAFTLSLSLASLLLSLAPIFALFLSAILFKEKITGRKLICLFLTLIGCLFVSGLLETSNGFHWSTHGMVFGLASALFWALYGVFSKLASNKGYSTFTIIFYTFLIISICLAPFTEWNIFGSFLMANPTPNIIFAIFHSVFTSILPYFLFSVALSNIDNGKATILCSSAEPISATIFGALIYLEIPSSLNIFGIIISLIGLALLTKSNETGDE